MIKRLAYWIVYKDLTKDDGCGMFIGKYDAKNGKTSFINGIWTLMEHIAYEVSERTGDKFNDIFMRNLEESERKAESRCGLRTGRLWK